MPDKFLNKYRISSARLSNWDYSSNAAYFLTICTARRQHCFGTIINSEMQLSKIGEYATLCWINIPDHFPFFYLDAFVVMPNHIHGMVLIEKPFINNSRGFNVVETRHALSLQQPYSAESPKLESRSHLPHFRFRNQG